MTSTQTSNQLADIVYAAPIDGDLDIVARLAHIVKALAEQVESEMGEHCTARLSVAGLLSAGYGQGLSTGDAELVMALYESDKTPEPEPEISDQDKLRMLAELAQEQLDDEHADRQLIAEQLIQAINQLADGEI